MRECFIPGGRRREERKWEKVDETQPVEGTEQEVTGGEGV